MAIEVKDISKSYNGQVVLDHINISVEDKAFLYMTGKSGRGKTTLFRIIMGLERPDSGEILGIEGKKISVMFQENRLMEYLTPIMNIYAVSSISKEKIHEELVKILPEDCLEKPVCELSGGMKRRVALVRAMIGNADIILLDEPLKGLDYGLKQVAVNYIMEKKGNAIVWMISHEMDEIKLLKSCKIINL